MCEVGISVVIVPSRLQSDVDTGRVQILQRHMRNVVTSPGANHLHLVQLILTWFNTDVDTMIIARGTPGFSGADLSNMVK